MDELHFLNLMTVILLDQFVDLGLIHSELFLKLIAFDLQLIHLNNEFRYISLVCVFLLCNLLTELVDDGSVLVHLFLLLHKILLHLVVHHTYLVKIKI